MRTIILILLAWLAVGLFLASQFGEPASPNNPQVAAPQASPIEKSGNEAPQRPAAALVVAKAKELYRDLAPKVKSAVPQIQAVYNKAAWCGVVFLAIPLLMVDLLFVDTSSLMPLVTDLDGWVIPTPTGALVFAFGWIVWMVVPVRIAKALGLYNPFDSLFFWKPISYRIAARLREAVIIARLFGKQATGDWANWIEVLSNRYVVGDVFLGRPKCMLRPIGLKSEKHMITIAGTGSGKTTAALIPNILLHRGSLLCIDPKGEIAMITAARRRELGDRVFVLDPFKIVPGVESASYNVFDELSRVAEVDPDAVYSYASKIAQALVKTMSRDAYWDNASITFLTGLILYVFTQEPEERRNLVRLRQLLMEGDFEAHAEAVSEGTIAPGDLTPFDVLLEKMISLRNKPLGQVIAGAASSLKQMGPNQMGGVVTSAQENTSFLDSPSIQRISLKSDFLLAGLKNRRTSVYLSLPLNAVRGKEGSWLRMFVLLFVDMMMREPKKPKDPILLAIDEFPSLGRLDGIDVVAPVLRSYGVRFWAIAQDIDQLAAVYPDCWEGFIGGAEAVQFMGIKHAGTVRFISQLIGNHVVEEMDELSGRVRRVERPVIEPNQISRLLAKDQGTQIIWRGDKRPMLLKITPYYEYMREGYYTPDPRREKKWW